MTLGSPESARRPASVAGATSAAPHVAVIGGGLAGMAAALACADAGAKVTLLEKRGRLGGLTWSFSHDGLVMDNGQHVFLRCCTAYLDFLDRIGSAGDVFLQPRLDLTVLRARPGRPPERAVLRRGPGPAPLHLASSLLRYRHVPAAQRARIGLAAGALARLDLEDPALDQENFEHWLQRHFQGPQAIEALWDLICLPTVNLPAREASLAMAAKVFQTGLLSEAKAADIGWARLPLGVLHGERGASALRKAGASLHLGTAVRGVEKLPEGGFRVIAGGELQADAVVVALPHHLVEQVLPAGALPEDVRPAHLGSSPIVNVHVHYDRPVTNLPFVAGLGTPAQWVFDRTGPSGAPRGQYLAVSVSAADSHAGTSSEELERQMVVALGELFPRAKQAKVLGTFVSREQNATFRAAPGSAAHRAPPRTRLPGLTLAGAWTSTGWPPTMEGAVRSGLAAARAALVGAGQRNHLPKVVGPARLQDLSELQQPRETT
ncbi:MAG: hydroxysqualene dehydroxylase HpnE [Actinomycetota bacterium]|nr:hydroxysqualene dehydroxylase HpnE [Actinomycetota bacterium]